MRPLALGAVALLLGAGLAGCLEPYRPRVDPDALAAITPPWTEEVVGRRSDGWFGPRTVETKYLHPAGDQPPFPGVLQVFGIRQLDGRSVDELLQQTRAIVDQALARENILVDPAHDLEGERSLRSGLDTKWFVHQGRVQGDGELFAEDVVVRVIGEVGRDGISNTGFVAVGLVQVERQVRGPVCTDPPIVGCQSGLQRQADERTWRSLAGDPQGSVGGAVAQHALLWDLVTHG